MKMRFNQNEGGGNPTRPITNFKATAGIEQIVLNWTNPAIQDTFNKVKIIRNLSHYPNNPTDGDVVYEGTSNNYTDTNLIGDVEYFYRAFTYSYVGIINNDESMKTSATAQPKPPYSIMTAIIDLTNSNPSTSITYADDAIGMTPGSAAWDNFFKLYPCLFQNGKEVGVLNKNNFAQFEDGSTADITSGNAGDVMIAFPRMGLRITSSADGNTVTIKMTDNPDDPNFDYLAHTRGATKKDKFYLGAYKGYATSTATSTPLRSLSGKAPTVNVTIGNFRTKAQLNGSGYEQSGFHQLTFRQAMFILKYKNLNSQVALGQGYTGGSSAQSTGATNTNGMDYGTTSTTSRVKCFGLEDFWGNIFEWIDGLFCDSSRNILTGTDGFNNTGSGYINQGQGATSNLSGYISRVQGTSGKGFIPKVVSGSATTYFADYGFLYAGYLPVFGGDWTDDSYAGAFSLYVYYSASYASDSVGARLMYL